MHNKKLLFILLVLAVVVALLIITIILPSIVKNIFFTSDLNTQQVRLNKLSCINLFKLTISQQQLVNDSKEALIKSGFSEQYVNDNFCVIGILDSTKKVKTVQWKYAIKEYVVELDDLIDDTTHLLGKNHNVTNPIPKSKILEILRTCLRFPDSKALAVNYYISGPIQLVLEGGGNQEHVQVDLETGTCNTTYSQSKGTTD